MTDLALDAAIHMIQARAVVDRPCIVAIDGRSGVGKSTFAQRLADRLPAVVIEGDDFFVGGVEIRHDTPKERAQACIDWQSQRRVLETLRRNERASWHRFDWDKFDGGHELYPIVCEPAPLVLLEGVYSARPELTDLVDVAILLRVAPERRIAQLMAREGTIGPWERQWHEAETYYFGEVVTPERFDLVTSPTLRS